MGPERRNSKHLLGVLGGCPQLPNSENSEIDLILELSESVQPERAYDTHTLRIPIIPELTNFGIFGIRRVYEAKHVQSRTSGPARPAQLADNGGDKPCTQAEASARSLTAAGEGTETNIKPDKDNRREKASW